ncbi:MAG: winged helix-turn-helix transcriptional regulator [Candidatus Aenigmarchaeota archaeon]|nr:winged helix-turn-helix transcriptional regulator [Candidatus Aenigmarchaeota archaeon]
MRQKIIKISEKVKVDKKDIEILRILENDGRIPILKLAKMVKLSHETVRYRLRKLVRSGVIRKFTVRINKKKLGYHIYAIIMLSTWNYTEEKWNELFKYLMDHKNVATVEKITGDFDLKFSFWAKDTEELDFISHTVKTKFSKIIKNWNSFIFTKRYKWNELPI